MRWRLSKLLGEVVGEDPAEPYSREDFSARALAFLQAHGCQARPSRLETEEEHHRWILRYALRMLDTTYARLEHPAPDPPLELVQRFREVLPHPPEEAASFFQGRIDAASSCRRAIEVRRSVERGPVLCLGDDDGTSVALALLGVEEVFAIDIDPRVLGWLEASGQPLRLELADVQSLPRRYHSCFEAVVTDPVRDHFLGGRFLQAAERCLRPGGGLFWADHPDWNWGYPYLERRTRGLQPIRRLENWHSYRAAYVDDSTAEHFGIDPAWMRSLADEARLWSHLQVLRKP